MPSDRPRRTNSPRGATSPRPGGPRSGGARNTASRSAGSNSGAPRKPSSRPQGRSTGSRGSSSAEGSQRSSFKKYGVTNDRKPYGDRGAGRSSGPRREGGAGRPDRGEGKSYGERRSFGERGAGRPERGERKPYGDRSDRGPRTQREERIERPLTAAEKKAREVRARTGGRRTQGHGEPTSAPKSSRVEWIDEGAVRSTARRATRRASGDTPVSPARIKGIPRADRPLPGGVAKEVERGVGARQSKSASERLQKAIDAFERERYAEAAKLLAALGRQLPRMALVHELAGLCAYRQEKWRTVVNELEATRVLDPSRTSVLPVLADAYRALRRWNKVNDLWGELKGLSPHPEVLAEGRIVMAGALADQGKITEAVALFGSVLAIPKRVQEYHLRQWYVVADLNDRAGNVVDARRLFDRVAKFDRTFADVDERIAQLGSPR